MRFRCPCCKPNLERRPRHGWFEINILKRIGLHPWECRQCRLRLYRKERFAIPEPGLVFKPSPTSRAA